MPENNAFQHQVYPTVPGSRPWLRTLRCQEGSASEFASLHSSYGIGRVVLVHGTFMGDDPFALSETLTSLGQGIPLFAAPLERISTFLREKTPRAVAAVTKDIGNYTPEFRDLFQQLVGDDPAIELLSPRWSGQNHHLARAELAVQLLSQLLQHPLENGQRILLWGHSHAGNAFALLTNLIANDKVAVARFFDAVGKQTGSHWDHVKELLLACPSPLPLNRNLVIVTFGTPVRYGWDTAGCASLIHVIHHRPHDKEHPFRTKPLFPPLLPQDVMNAEFGDWVQAFAIAGTDVSSVPAGAANQRLTQLLEGNLPEPKHETNTRFIQPQRLRDACARWRYGTRCHTDGLNILVDYLRDDPSSLGGRTVEASLLGHGVATTRKWLAAHLNLVTEALTDEAASPRNSQNDAAR